MDDTQRKRFGRSFQEAIAANCFRYTDVLSLCSAHIPLDYFDSTALSGLVGIAYNYYSTYRALPSRAAMIELLSDKVENGKLPRDDLREHAEIADKLLRPRQPDRDFVRDRLSAFIRQTAMAEAIVKSVDLLKEGRYEEIREEVKAALTAGDLTLGHYYQESIDVRIARRNMLEDEGVPTLIPGLDAALGGGLRRKELGVLMGPPGRGKSIGLLHLSKVNMILGGVGVHYTLEMSEDRIADRLDSSLSGIAHKRLKDESELLRKKLKSLARPNALIIKEWPTKKATPDMLRAHLDNMIGAGTIPTLVCVDYGDILKAHTHYNERRHEVASNFEELRAIAVEYNVPVWTGTQANKESLSKAVITMQDIAESFEKCAIADVIVSICQTDDELDSSQLRFYMAKNRDNPSRFAVGPLFCDFSRMCFYQREDPLERRALAYERTASKRGEVPGGARRIYPATRI